MKLDKTFLIAVMLFILMSCSSIFALTIETQFIGGAAPRNAVGGGNLTDLVNAAARIWESSYSDTSVLTIVPAQIPSRTDSFAFAWQRSFSPAWWKSNCG